MALGSPLPAPAVSSSNGTRASRARERLPLRRTPAAPTLPSRGAHARLARNMTRRNCMPTVGLVGVGLIGRAWANVFSRAGWDVRLWDPDAAALARAPALIAQALEDVARHGLAKD